MNFPLNTTLAQLKRWGTASPENQFILDLCIPSGLEDDTPLSGLDRSRGGFILSALNAVCDLQRRGKRVLYDLYTPDEIQADATKEQAKLLFFPGEPDKPFVVVLPGGGYQMVAVLDEGIQDALEFNRLGYSAAVLIYRVGIENIMPRPVEDLARAIQLIQTAGSEIECDRSEYLLAGFSSGGHLAGMWCSPAYGYRQYGLSAPAAVFAAYPLVSVSTRKLMLEHKLGSKSELCHVEGDIRLLCGSTDVSIQQATKYDIDRIVDETCPPCYLIHGLEDSAVFCSNSELWADALERRNVPHILRLVEGADHAFSTGEGTDAEGWFADAIQFYQEVTKL